MHKKKLSQSSKHQVMFTYASENRNKEEIQTYYFILIYVYACMGNDYFQSWNLVEYLKVFSTLLLHLRKINQAVSDVKYNVKFISSSQMKLLLFKKL